MKRDNLSSIQLILDLHKADGAIPVGEMDGLWNRKLSDEWEIWVNGQLGTMKTPEGVDVGPGDCYVEFNGWPTGIFSLITGEGEIAAGSIANYDTFCLALREAATEIAKLRCQDETRMLGEEFVSGMGEKP